MKLSLGTRKVKPSASKNGTVRIGSKELIIIDLDTGNELQERVAMLWGGKDLLTTGGEPLLTDEHFSGDQEDAGYLIVVVRCDSAKDLDD